MSASFDQIQIIGQLSQEPEMRFTPNGTTITRLNIPVHRKYKNAEGESSDETVWYVVSVFGKQAENCNEYLKKHSSVLVIGTLRAENGGPRIYTKKDGTPGAQFEISANTVRFLSTKKEDDSSNEQAEETLAIA